MDEFEKLVANADQMGEHMKEIIAPILWSYFEALVKNGFTREESLLLATKLQESFFGSVSKGE